MVIGGDGGHLGSTYLDRGVIQKAYVSIQGGRGSRLFLNFAYLLCGWSQDIQKKPCFVNSDIGELSSDFLKHLLMI